MKPLGRNLHQGRTAGFSVIFSFVALILLVGSLTRAGEEQDLQNGRRDDSGLSGDERFAGDQTIATRALTKEDIVKRHMETMRVARRKLLQARLMFKVKRLQECIDLCDEALALDPGNEEALGLKKEASALRLGEQTKLLDAERKVRDQALLEKATEEGLPEPVGPKVLRPALSDNKFPFSEDPKMSKVNKDILNIVIPEINLTDVQLNEVLQILYKYSGVNIIYKPEDVADKTVTILARDRSIEDILKYINRTLEMNYTVDNGAIWIYSKDNDEEVKRSMMTPVIIPISSGMFDAGPGSASDGGDSTGGGGGNGGGGGAGEGSSGDGSTHIEEVMTWMESNWPGWPAESKWRIDTKTSSLLLVSTPQIIKDVRKIIKMLDVPCPQALVVTRFVKVSQTDLDQLGFSWDLTPNPNSMPNLETADGQPVSKISWKDNKTRLKTTSANVAVAADAFTTGFTSILNDHALSMTLQALASSTDSKVLIAPRVIAQNDRWAMINLTDKLIYYDDVEAIQNDVTTDNNAQSSTVIVPTDRQEEEIGYKLKVKPRIGADMKTINLKIIPDITTKVRDETKPVVVTTVDGQETVVDIKIPIINQQTLTVDASVEDNQTLVVGGLFLDNDSDAHKGVPVLKNIPVLGKFFKSKDRSRTRSCLLIFVTVRILTPRNSTYTDNKRLADRQGEEDKVLRGDIGVDTLNRWLGDPMRE